MATRIQLRRGTSLQWISANPILSQGELGIELDTGKIKIGNGSATWTSLPYFDDKETDFEGYATEQYVDDSIGAIEIPDVSSFITAEDLPEPVDLSGYATEQYVNDAVDAIEIPDVSSFITAEDIPAIPTDISELTDTEGLLGGGVDSDPTQLFFEAGEGENLVSHNVGFVEGDPPFQIRLNSHLNGEEQTVWGFSTDGTLTLPEGGDIKDSDGNSVLGGSADTGDITFDGVKIIGAGTASGDGNGYATLELVPDNNLYANDQYLVVDPTAPSHIHIRAGGAQDASNAELYLGGEKNYVRVTDFSGVRLYNESSFDNTEYYLDGAQFTSAIWTAGAEGQQSTVTFTSTDQSFIDILFNFFNDDRNTLQVVTPEGTFTLTPTGFGSLGNDVWRFNVNEIPDPTPQTVSEIILTIWTTQQNSVGLDNDFTVNVSDDVRITGRDTFSLRNNSADEPITIITNYDGDNKRWEFGADGDLTFPDNTTQTTAWAGGRVVAVPDSSVGAEGDNAGDIAFSSGHIYYCFEDYNSSVSYNTTLSNITEDDNKFIFAKGEGIVEPEIGWSITVDVGGANEETHTITLVEDLATDWRVTWSGDNVTFDPGTAIRVFSTNIWKRVAWSNDVW